MVSMDSSSGYRDRPDTPFTISTSTLKCIHTLYPCNTTPFSPDTGTWNPTHILVVSVWQGGGRQKPEKHRGRRRVEERRGVCLTKLTNSARPHQTRWSLCCIKFTVCVTLVSINTKSPKGNLTCPVKVFFLVTSTCCSTAACQLRIQLSFSSLSMERKHWVQQDSCPVFPRQFMEGWKMWVVSSNYI